MTAPADLDAVEQVLAQYEIARQQRAPKPGRGKLAEATGLSPHHVRQAIDKINAASAPEPAPPSPRANPGHTADDHQIASRAATVAGKTGPWTATAAGSPAGLTQAPGTPTSSASWPPGAYDRRQHHVGAGERQGAPGRPAGGGGSPTRRTTASAASALQPSPGSSAPRSPSREPTASPREGVQPGGTAVSWLGFAFGSVTSIAANVLHTWLPASSQPPGLGPQIGAGVWPIALIVTVEVLTRVNWRRAWFWNTVRYGIGSIVAIGSFAISYGHIHAVLIAWHYDPIAAAIGPLVLDGLMTISGFALLTAKLSYDGNQAAKVTN